MPYYMIDQKLSDILKQYQNNFSKKIYTDVYDSTDILMETFGITQKLKRENKQFWGRQLGACWQYLIAELCKSTCKDYGDALRFNRDEPCDLVVGKNAIDTKYRMGSGDSGTLKKFRQYGTLLQDENYQPVILCVREDNLPAAMTACKAGGWLIYTGTSTFDYIERMTKFDLYQWLCHHRDNGTFIINREQI